MVHGFSTREPAFPARASIQLQAQGRDVVPRPGGPDVLPQRLHKIVQHLLAGQTGQQDCPADSRILLGRRGSAKPLGHQSEPSPFCWSSGLSRSSAPKDWLKPELQRKANRLWEQTLRGYLVHGPTVFACWAALRLICGDSLFPGGLCFPPPSTSRLLTLLGAGCSRSRKTVREGQKILDRAVRNGSME